MISLYKYYLKFSIFSVFSWPIFLKVLICILLHVFPTIEGADSSIIFFIGMIDIFLKIRFTKKNPKYKKTPILIIF